MNPNSTIVGILGEREGGREGGGEGRRGREEVRGLERVERARHSGRREEVTNLSPVLGQINVNLAVRELRETIRAGERGGWGRDGYRERQVNR